jgi:hypothetical protein
LAAVYDGASRTEAARIGGVTLQIVRDWVLRFNAEGPGGLVNRKAPGQTPRLNDGHRTALAAVLDHGCRARRGDGLAAAAAGPGLSAGILRCHQVKIRDEGMVRNKAIQLAWSPRARNREPRPRRLTFLPPARYRKL